jgi:signal transduction histidine kinase
MIVSRQVGMAGVATVILSAGIVLWAAAPPGPALAAFGDVSALVLLVAVSTAMLADAITLRRARAFWTLLGFGCLLWTIDMALWTYWEVIRNGDLPDPFIGDVILFIHVVPFMAAIALRPHRPRKDSKALFDTINFLTLLGWWVFLYAFVVFPDEYVVLNAPLYSRHYDVLYLLENLVLVLVLGAVASSTPSNWRKIYWNLFVAFSLYTIGSEVTNAAIARKRYHSGSVYDLPLLVSIGWLLWTALRARRMPLEPSVDDEPASRWVDLAPRLAMIAILSLPLFGLWTLLAGAQPPLLRNVRLLVTLLATLFLGLFIFFKQFLLDRQLISLLDQSRQSYENLQRLQSHLVQKEKLASLGQLVAGAAHEINNPLAAILGYSELLVSEPSLRGEQATMAQKIGQQARRTRDLVADLLSFSQQNPAEKILVDVAALVQRALQMHDVQIRGRSIRIEPDVPDGIPRIWGNSNQLLQTFLHLTENAIDALNDVGGGSLRVTVRQEDDQVVVVFSDSGPGLADPQRVFDPFYTTKPIGKGTGLGLSASYGVVQDHQGHIACYNKPEGGAEFVVRFPVASQAAAALDSGI